MIRDVTSAEIVDMLTELCAAHGTTLEETLRLWRSDTEWLEVPELRDAMLIWSDGL